MLFRDGAVPSWEVLISMPFQLAHSTQHFPNGGAFSLHLKRHSLHLNRFWEELLISAIGEGFDSSDVIGIAVHIRPKEESIFIWLKEISHRYQIASASRKTLLVEFKTTVLYYSYLCILFISFLDQFLFPSISSIH